MITANRARRAATAASALLIATVAGLSDHLNTAWSAPPRYDGAGYAVLARALLEGEGYRAIDHPDRPPHVHFPPGYPLLLAATWRATGVSTIAARAVSIVATVGAALAAWWWFRRMMSRPAAILLGLALALNWLWARTGGAIQSEPMYLLLSQAAILVAATGGRPVVLGLLIGAAMMTRQVAVGLAMGVLLDLAIRRQWRDGLVVGVAAALVVSPWLLWLAAEAGAGGRSQAELLFQGGDTWLGRLAGQVVFYGRRIPDQIAGPFVEVATAFRGDSRIATAADLWAALATAVIALGWMRCLRRPRRRLAGLVPIATLLILLAWPYTEAGRFLIPMIPCLLVGAAEGGAWVLGRLGSIRASRRRIVAAGLVFAASLPYAIYATAAGKSRAAEAAQGDFDAACAWLARRATRPGPVLARHPGDVFWQTGRTALEVASSERPGDADADAVAIARAIERYGVAYLLVDRERYAHAPPGPLARFVDRFPGRAREVWRREGDGSAVVIYEVVLGW